MKGFLMDERRMYVVFFGYPATKNCHPATKFLSGNEIFGKRGIQHLIFCPASYFLSGNQKFAQKCLFLKDFNGFGHYNCWF
jgi:hypothetical protein